MTTHKDIYEELTHLQNLVVNDSRAYYDKVESLTRKVAELESVNKVLLEDNKSLRREKSEYERNLYMMKRIIELFIEKETETNHVIYNGKVYRVIGTKLEQNLDSAKSLTIEATGVWPM